MPEPEHRNALPKGFEIYEYRIDSILGHGGFGITYLAKDTNLDQFVAIKEYLPNDLAVREGVSTVFPKSTLDKDAFQWGLERFLLEAKTLAQFHHPNIVRVLRFFEDNHTAYMVMAYQPGESLSRRLKRDGKVAEAELMNIVLPILDGLREVHAAGFLHRDIKPSNIYLCEDGTPILLDFGAARYAVGGKSRSLTSVVTPGYAPFEQYDSGSEQGPWTDIYALGAVMYAATSGKTPQDVVRRLKNDEMPRAVKLGENRYRSELLQAIDWAMAVDEQVRPQTIDEWREALLTGPVEKLVEPKHKSSQPMPDEQRRKLVIGAVLVFILLLGGYLGTQLLRSFYDPAKLFAPPPEIVHERVETFVLSFLNALSAGQLGLDNLLNHYADEVEFFNLGVVPKTTVLDDKVGFYGNWPLTDYSLRSGTLSIQDTDKANEKLVVFEIDYVAWNLQKPLRSQGAAKQTLRIRFGAAGPKIILEKQTNINRKINGYPLPEHLKQAQERRE